MLLSVMSVFPMLAQETITVNGIVVDASTQEPLIGASILIKGTTTGTMTGIDGDFKGVCRNVRCTSFFVHHYTNWFIFSKQRSFEDFFDSCVPSI